MLVYQRRDGVAQRVGAALDLGRNGENHEIIRGFCDIIGSLPLGIAQVTLLQY